MRASLRGAFREQAGRAPARLAAAPGHAVVLANAVRFMGPVHPDLLPRCAPGGTTRRSVRRSRGRDRPTDGFLSATTRMSSPRWTSSPRSPGKGDLASNDRALARAALDGEGPADGLEAIGHALQTGFRTTSPRGRIPVPSSSIFEDQAVAPLAEPDRPQRWPPRTWRRSAGLGGGEVDGRFDLAAEPADAVGWMVVATTASEPRPRARPADPRRPATGGRCRGPDREGVECAAGARPGVCWSISRTRPGLGARCARGARLR